MKVRDYDDEVDAALPHIFWQTRAAQPADIKKYEDEMKLPHGTEPIHFPLLNYSIGTDAT